jgi:sugar phosphate isomerase/epimerase
MPIAIQQNLLPGSSVHEQFEYARALGVSGVEVWAEGLTARVPALAEAAQATGVRIAAVNMGRRDGYLAPERAEREAAISALRQAMADAVDLEAGHVVFVPLFGSSRMPDLTPYRSAIELDVEMLIWLLRTVSDLAYALGVELDILPVNRYESSLLNRLDQTVRIRRKIKEHPHIKLAANLFHMALEENHSLPALSEHLPHIGYIQLAEPNGALPGLGTLDWAALAAALRDYPGWLTCVSHQPQPGDLQTSLRHLRAAGLLS